MELLDHEILMIVGEGLFTLLVAGKYVTKLKYKDDIVDGILARIRKYIAQDFFDPSPINGKK